MLPHGWGKGHGVFGADVGVEEGADADAGLIGTQLVTQIGPALETGNGTTDGDDIFGDDDEWNEEMFAAVDKVRSCSALFRPDTGDFS